jgi:hypothetical protein
LVSNQPNKENIELSFFQNLAREKKWKDSNHDKRKIDNPNHDASCNFMQAYMQMIEVVMLKKVHDHF